MVDIMWKFPGRNGYKKLDYIKDDDGDVFIELKRKCAYYIISYD